MIFFGRVFFLCLHRTCTEDFVHPYLKVEHKKAERKERMGFLMPNNNRYEISEALQMPLPLTKEEAMQETLTQEESAARRFPILPSNANVTVIPIIPGITLFGYIRFLNA